VRICLLAANCDKDRTLFAGAGIVSDVEHFEVQLPGCGGCVYVTCQISQFQFVLDALALADSPPEGGFGAVSTAIFLTGLLRKFHATDGILRNERPGGKDLSQ